MKRLLFVCLLAVDLAACGPLTSVACDRAAALCAQIDRAACDGTMELVPPRIRSDIVSCAQSATDCAAVTRCFTRNQLHLPTTP